MSPYRLALRTLLLARTRSVLAMLMVAASLCVLDLFAGHIASVRARMEVQAVIGERLGHLTILRSPHRDDNDQIRMFPPEEAAKIRSVLDKASGIALVMPQMRVGGIAATGQRSALFHGEGVMPLPDGTAGKVPPLPGKLSVQNPNGIAVSSGQARTLGLQPGSKLTLTGAGNQAAPQQLKAEVVDVFSTGDMPDGDRAVVMPFDMAQALLDTSRTERFVLFLSDPEQLEEQRALLGTALRAVELPVEVRTWQEQSSVYVRERAVSDLAFDSVAGMVFAVIAATIAATMSINVLERRREVATLRAFGMRSHAVFLMYVAEALGMALAGVAASLVGSALIAWIVNRVALSYGPEHAATGPMLVELDPNRMLMAVVMVVAVALLAALVPAFKAARVGIAPALAA